MFQSAFLALLTHLMLVGPSFAQSCSFLVGTMTFNPYNPLSGAAMDGAVTFSINCNGTTSVTRHCLSIGAGNYADSTSRQMASGSNRLRYEFYVDSARTQKWGSYETGGIGRQIDVAADGLTGGTAYVRILPNQQTTPPSGTTYDDTRSANVITRYRSGTSQNCPVSSSTTNTHINRVEAIVPANCNVSAGTLNFGTATNLSSLVDSASTIFVQCTNTTPYTVTLNGGYTGDVNARTMFANERGIRYQLYKDAARSQVWGDTSSAGVSGTGTGLQTSLTVYGRVPVQATPPGAAYADLIVVTVTY